MKSINRDTAWLRMYGELRQFKCREGHCNVPQRFSDNRSLGAWVSSQRKQYELMRQGKPSYITEFRIQSLEKIGFQWSLKNQNGDKWRKMYEALMQFKCREGHCNVPRRFFRDNKSLGEWVTTQRTQYKYLKQGKSASITKSRIRALEKIGFQWSLKDHHDDTWFKMYGELKQFKCREGHCRVPRRFFRDNKSLGMWVHNQRKQYKYIIQGKPSSITESRIKKLENIGFQWSVKDLHDTWYKRHEELKQFKCREGHCNVPCRLKSLGMRVHDQRKYYKSMQQGKASGMTEARVQALEKIGFQWNLTDPLDDAWCKMYEELNKFKCREGHCNVPQQYSDNKSLGLWVAAQRRQYIYMKQGKSSSITKSKICALEKIEFQWFFKDHACYKMSEDLKQFKCREGLYNVPQEFSGNKREYWI